MGASEPIGLIGVAQHVGHFGKYVQVLVGFRSDPDNKVGFFARVPLDAGRNLQDRDASLPDHATILGKTMRDGDAITEERGRHQFPRQHALDVSGLDMAGRNQQRADLANGLVLVRRVSADVDPAASRATMFLHVLLLIRMADMTLAADRFTLQP